jgi:hypothetical protein
MNKRYIWEFLFEVKYYDTYEKNNCFINGIVRDTCAGRSANGCR